MRQSVVHSFAHSFIDSVNRKPRISGPWMQKTLSLPFRSQSIQGDEHVRSQLKYRTISYHEERHLPSSCGIPEAKVSEATSQGVGFWVNTWSRRVTWIRGQAGVGSKSEKSSATGDHQLLVALSKKNIKTLPRRWEFHAPQKKTQEKQNFLNLHLRKLVFKGLFFFLMASGCSPALARLWKHYLL